MKKILGTTNREISKYPLDYFSILHFMFGVIGYICAFFLINIFILDWLTALFLTYLTIILSGIFWEIAENSFLIWTKVFDEQDSPINSQVDVLLVFLGGILGCCIWNLNPLTIIFVIGGLSIAFMLGRILTIKNSKK